MNKKQLKQLIKECILETINENPWSKVAQEYLNIFKQDYKTLNLILFLVRKKNATALKNLENKYSETMSMNSSDYSKFRVVEYIRNHLLNTDAPNDVGELIDIAKKQKEASMDLRFRLKYIIF